MQEFYNRLPDPDDVLALSPKELAVKLLLILRKNDKPINIPSITDLIPVARPHFRKMDGYPEDRCDEIRDALWKAFIWLDDRGLIERNTNHPESGWTRVLSSDVKDIRSEEDFQKLMLWRSVNEDMLHPKIARKAVACLARGDYAEAISFAMRSVEIAVRDACGPGTEKIGVKLTHHAFGKDGPLRNREAEESEEEGLRFLFAGVIGAYKNPHSHRDVHVEDISEAVTLVMFASHLLRIVDSRKPQK